MAVFINSCAVFYGTADECQEVADGFRRSGFNASVSPLGSFT
jgi:hypothetical protein